MGSTYSAVCPGCGGSPKPGTNICEFCGKELFITTFNPLFNMNFPDVNKYMRSYSSGGFGETDEQKAKRLMALGLCQLKFKLYDKAAQSFEEVVNIAYDCAEAYYCAAVCVFKGNRPFLSNIKSVERAEQLLSAALSVSGKGIYYLFAAFIKKDFYERKFYKTSPSSRDYKAEADKLGVPQGDKTSLEQLLNTRIDI